MKNAIIDRMFIFANYECSVSIKDDSGDSVEIKMTNESLADKNLDERYQILKARADQYIKCNTVTE